MERLNLRGFLSVSRPMISKDETGKTQSQPSGFVIAKPRNTVPL